MFVQHITIQNFGSILSCTADFAPGLNLIDSRYTSEISAALAFLLCSKGTQEIPERWLQKSTQISARIRLAGAVYTVCAKPESGRLQLSAVDPSGADATARYRYALSHCPEQDAIEAFDGQDKTMPFCLCRYRNREDHGDLSQKTQRLTDTKAFRRHLLQYIQTFQSEPINSKKNYQVAIDSQGKFQAFYPGVSGKVHLSQTEEKLFLYSCFLHIAEFWADIEKIRDLHHEKKPLVIRNFLEFLDESTDISGLIARTIKLQRQVITVTPPLDEEIKKKWIGKDGFRGILFQSGS